METITGLTSHILAYLSMLIVLPNLEYMAMCDV